MDGKYITLTTAVAVLFFCLFVGGCGNTDDRDVEGVVRLRVEERTQALTDRILADCQEDILEVATKMADSLLIDRARRLSRLDGRPPKPRRPGAPPIKELSAPLPLRPLFPFEIRFDTLLRDSLRTDSIYQDSLQRLMIDDGLWDEPDPDN